MSDLGHRYLWGPAVDQLLADENASTNVIIWPLPDHLGTIRDWVNNSGTNLDHAEYDTSGRRLNTAAIDEVFGRAGLFHDKYTGNDYARNRWLDPETGRWLSQDPIGFHGGSFSLYVYAGNAATVATDPSGLTPNVDNALTLEEFLDMVRVIEAKFPNESARETLVRVRVAVKGPRSSRYRRIWVRWQCILR